MKNRTFEKVLIDGGEGVHVDGWSLDADALVGAKSAPWSIRKYSLTGGRQDGVDIVELDTGPTTIVAVPTRGMNILSAHTDDATIGWESPVQEVVHPAYVNVHDRGGTGFLDGFNEMIARCGLENMGAPCEDTIEAPTGEETTVELPLHGRISNIPAVRVWVSVELEEPYRLSVTGELYETRLFGPSYRLTSTLSAIPGQTGFRITDEVQNLSGTASEMELLYHCNFGPPLLEEGSRAIVPVKTMSPRDGRAAEGVEEWNIYGPPTPGFNEQTYYCRLHGDDDGRTKVGLANANRDLGISLAFSTEQLPAFALWKNTTAERDGYATGLEPGTGYPNTRPFERQKGRVNELGTGETYRADLEINMHQDGTQVKEMMQEIDELTEGRESQLLEDIDPDLSPAGSGSG